MPGADDRPLRAQRGELDAFNELLLEYERLVYNLCYRLLGQTQSAEDATQEAFIAAWRNIHSFRGDSFRAWLLRIATNVSRDELRRRARRPSSSLEVALEAGVPDPPDPARLPENAALDSELRGRLEAALADLPEDQGTAVYLCDVEGFDYNEIALVMRCSLGTVKSRIARGRMRLRELLQHEAELLPGAGRPDL